MKRRTSGFFSLAVLFLGLFVSTNGLLAGPQIFDYGPDSCTGTNCNSVAFNGTYHFGPFDNANPFILQVFSAVFSAGGECVRLDVTAAGTDLEMVLVSPNGTVWRNDDRPGSLNPLIKAITSSGTRGWYTLQVSRYNGEGPYADFTLQYGRYTSSNPNCSSPTAPTLLLEPELKPLGIEAGPNLRGGTLK
jgi:hypothetical protein